MFTYGQKGVKNSFNLLTTEIYIEHILQSRIQNLLCFLLNINPLAISYDVIYKKKYQYNVKNWKEKVLVDHFI